MNSSVHIYKSTRKLCKGKNFWNMKQYFEQKIIHFLCVSQKIRYFGRFMQILITKWKKHFQNYNKRPLNTDPWISEIKKLSKSTQFSNDEIIEIWKMKAKSNSVSEVFIILCHSIEFFLVMININWSLCEGDTK